MKIRYAHRSDIKNIINLIMELAIYEKLENEVIATPELLEEWAFDKEKCKILLCEIEDKIIGYCIYFYNFSTFLGKAGIYIEDIYITPNMRGNGYGKTLFQEIAKIADEEGCGRIDWNCLDWNQPSIDFYKSLGAIPLDEWTSFRLTEYNIHQLANRKK